MPVIYTCITPVFIWLCIRSGFRYFFVAANPTIKYGGFLMEPKHEIYNLLPKGYYPPTLYFKVGTKWSEINNILKANHFQYPLIIKPNIGMKGYAVKKVNNENELSVLISHFNIDFLIQKFETLPNEVGIFYCRYPNADTGFISGIVEKEFMTITGDGTSTLLQLIEKNDRYLLQLEALEKELGSTLQTVLKKDEEKVLMPYGNHARGSLFLDKTSLVTPKLSRTIDHLMKQVNGFYYGRVDIRYNTWQELEQGKNISIIELNGSGSEPTHIYDPNHSLFFAWKEIIRHWFILWRISKMNYKKGFRYMSLKEGKKMFINNNNYIKKLEKLHQQILG